MRWNFAQRVVLVVAYALVLWVLWGFVESAGWRQFGDDGGWYNYAPNSGVVFAEGMPVLVTNLTARVATQLAFVALWAIPSVWLLRTNERSVAREVGAEET